MSDKPLPRDPAQKPPPPPGLLARLIDNFNPGVTLLVLVWVIGLTARRYAMERGELSEIAYRGLTSLMFVVPLMLVAWALLAIADRYFGLGLFPRDEE